MQGANLPRYVLGVNTGPHDGSAALLRDGELVAMVEQERVSRNRHAFGESPSRAISECLKHEHITVEQVSEVAVGWDVPRLVEIERGTLNAEEFTSWMLGAACHSAITVPPITYVPHHLAHAASGFYTSGFSDAAILVIDGRGEDVATTIAVAGPSGIEIVATWGTDLSLGHFYGWAAEWAGLTMWGTGKLMGLAAYGSPSQPSPLTTSRSSYSIGGSPPPGGTPLDNYVRLRSRLRALFARRHFPFGEGHPDDVMAHADFAASMQHALETAVLHLASIARRETGLSRLVLTGGVALNCAANGRLIRDGVFEDVWIPPVPHDAGVSLGAALLIEQEPHPMRWTPPRRMCHASWAPAPEAPSDPELERLKGCTVTRYGDGALEETVARLLAEGLIVGWWQGRAEVGERALGARSILCDPRSRSALVKTNVAKGREGWRPLAPAVAARRSAALFSSEPPPVSAFMLAAWPMTESAQREVPGAVHVDGSARPQVVSGDASRYGRLIEAFYERTGVPCVINTSFNVAGEAIVLSASDALQTFAASALDVLVLDDVIVVKAVPGSTTRRLRTARAPSLAFTPWTTSAHVPRVPRGR